MKKIIASSIVALMLVGCGGGSGNTSEAVYSEDYQINTGESRTVTLQNDEGIIIGQGCTTAKLYDDQSVLIANTNSFSYIEVPNPLTQGTYTVVSSEFYNYTDSTGIIYFKSSGYYVPEFPINSQIQISDRDTNLYKLTLNSEQAFTIIKDSANFNLYNNNLEEIGTTNPFNSNVISDPMVLQAGTYYIVTYPFTCKDGGGGTLKVTPL